MAKTNHNIKPGLWLVCVEYENGKGYRFVEIVKGNTDVDLGNLLARDIGRPFTITNMVYVS